LWRWHLAGGFKLACYYINPAGGTPAPQSIPFDFDLQAGKNRVVFVKFIIRNF
jgi:hypothetical protein